MSIKAADIKKMSFETAINELERIVDSFASGGGNLEESIEEYAKAVKLKNQCEKKLTEAKLKIEKITTNDGGIISTTDFLSEDEGS